MTARATTRRTWEGGRKRIPDAPAEPKRSARKDTKRWCRGKVGVEHVYVWTDDARFDYFDERDNRGGLPRVLSCTACGRQKDWCWGATDCRCGAHKTTHEHATLSDPPIANCERGASGGRLPASAGGRAGRGDRGVALRVRAS